MSVADHEAPGAAGRPARPWLRYGLALAATATAVLTNLALELSTRESNSAPYLLATIVTAWFAGLAPALVAAGLGAAALACVPPEASPSVSLASLDIRRAIVVAAISAVVAWLTVGRREAHRAREALLRASEHNRRAAEAANRAKDEFLAMLSHELRTPMAAISAAGSVLERLPLGSPAASRACAVIARQTTQVSQIVDDLLDARRFATGRLTLLRRPLDLAVTVGRCVEALDIAGLAANHKLTCATESVWIDADETRIEQVVNNLLINALKYTPPGGIVTVWVRPSGDAAALDVDDTGIGIAEPALPSIFELFFQEPRGASASPGGLGIGLALVKQIVELHGGEISAASGGIDQGSSFAVRLPRIAPPPADAHRDDTPVGHDSESNQ
jgi:signal transduction histidine kinase